MQNYGFFGRVATFFLHHRELGVLTIIGIVLWGALSFALMPKQYNPEITAPAFQIVTPLPGASTEEVYQLVTRVVEDRVRTIPTVDKIMAQTFDGGVSVVIAQFYIGENSEDAKITLTQKLQDIAQVLPDGAQAPQISAIDPDDVPVLTVALSSEKLSASSLRALGSDVADTLKQIEGVAQVRVHGGARRVLYVTIDPDRLAQYGISLQQLRDRIRANNILMPAGFVTTQGNHYDVRIDGAVTSPQEVAQIVIGAAGATIIHVGDVADVTYSEEEQKYRTTFALRDGDVHNDSAVYVSVAKLKGTNATKITDAARAEVDALVRNGVIPSHVRATIVRDDGQVAREATMTLTTNLFSAIVIVALVLLGFLGWRSALIVLIAIPLTLAAVFGIGHFAGQTINRITLFALILSLGILVDAAIVVVENIFRLLRENSMEPKFTLIARAVAEVGPGLFMSTLTVILAFVPMAFVGGMMGPYMGPIPFFVPAALIASLLIALSINPFLLDMMTRHHGRISKECDGITPQNKRENIFLRSIGRLRGVYARFLAHILESSRRRRIIVFGALVLLLASLALPAVGIVKFRMLPKADTEQFFVYVDLPQYADLERTGAVVQRIENFLMQQDVVVSVQSFIGTPQVVDFNGLFKGSDARRNENQATLKVNLVHHKKRAITSEEIALALRPQIQALLRDEPDVTIKLIEDPPGPPVLSTFLLKIHGTNDAHIAQVATTLAQKIHTIDEVVDIDTTVNEVAAPYVLRVKKEEASRAGLSVYDVAMTLRRLLDGERVALYHARIGATRQAEPEYIVVRTAQAQRDAKNDLENVLIPNAYGQNIPLGSVVAYETTPTVPVLYTDNRVRTQYVSAEMGRRSVIYAMIDTLTYLVREYKPFATNTEVVSWNLFGVTYRDKQSGEMITVLLDGEWKLTLEVFRDLGIAMGVALIMIYFVLVARFRSLVVPAIIMGTIPFSFIGVLPGFALLGWISGVYFNATSMIGVIALSGIVVNNAIMFLEYLTILRERGYSIEEAIIKTGKTRLLPIMLTTLTTILGSLTIISDPVWEGLAWSIVWGLSLAAFLTLVIFPILYYKFQRTQWRADATQ